MDWANKQYDDQYADTAPVGSYELGQSYFGVYDMAGNVWEWTASNDKPYPYKAEDERDNDVLRNTKIVRGGSWFTDGYDTSVTTRISFVTTDWTRSLGSRCVR